MASISGGAGNGINRMLRKKYHVVRKKYHVVRKLFYVASIFGGAAGRKKQAAVGTFFHAVGTFFHGGEFFFHGIPSEATPSMRLPSTRLFWGRSYKFTRHQYCQIFSSLAFLVPRPFECSSSISRKPPCHAVNFLPHPMSGFSFRKNKPEVHCLQGFELDDFARWKSVRAWRRVGLRQLSSACGCGAAQSGRCRGSGGSRAAG